MTSSAELTRQSAVSETHLDPLSERAVAHGPSWVGLHPRLRIAAIVSTSCSI